MKSERSERIRRHLEAHLKVIEVMSRKELQTAG